MNVLLIVDLQKEFMDTDGKFEQIVAYVQNTKEYDMKIATLCGNSKNSPYMKYKNWTGCMDGVSPLCFDCDKILYKEAYGLPDYTVLPKEHHYTLVGFNTGACVLKIALDLFDRGYDFRVLTEYCYSSEGKEHHDNGVEIMKNLMSDAIV